MSTQHPVVLRLEAHLLGARQDAIPHALRNLVSNLPAPHLVLYAIKIEYLSSQGPGRKRKAAISRHKSFHCFPPFDSRRQVAATPLLYLRRFTHRLEFLPISRSY